MYYLQIFKTTGCLLNTEVETDSHCVHVVILISAVLSMVLQLKIETGNYNIFLNLSTQVRLPSSRNAIIL